MEETKTENPKSKDESPKEQESEDKPAKAKDSRPQKGSTFAHRGVEAKK